MLTLFTTPIVYIYMDRFQSWLQSLFGRGQTHAAAPAPSPAHSD
jgi:hypothetical protein